MKKLLFVFLLVCSMVLSACGLSAEDLPDEVTVAKKIFNDSTVTVIPITINNITTMQTQVHPEEYILKIENKESEFMYTLYLTKAKFEQLEEGDILTKDDVLNLLK